MIVFPLAHRLIGVLIALAATAPIAFRRSHPVAAALVAMSVWVVPTDGYLVVGYVAILLILYSLAVEVSDLRVVGAVIALAVALAAVSLARNEESIGEWLGAGLVLFAPTVVGRLMRRQREQAQRLAELNRLLERDLSERESEVLALVGRGMSNAEIAGSLFISNATVKTHSPGCFRSSACATACRRSRRLTRRGSRAARKGPEEPGRLVVAAVISLRVRHEKRRGAHG